MPLIEGAAPESHEGGPVGILILHGFTGSPKSMKPWANFLAERGYTTAVPRLPGHGTSWQEMNRTRWTDWYAEANRALDELKGKCETVFVFGLSMGGSLTLRIAEERGDDVTGIAVVNPAVFTKRPDRFLLPYLQRFVPAFPGISNDIKKPDQDEGAYTKIPLKAAYSLTDLWSLTKSDLGRIHIPTLVFTSADDHVVEPENSEWIMEHVNSTDRTQIMLNDSYHVATLDNETELIFSESLNFIERLA
jgi:carboxylesterase